MTHFDDAATPDALVLAPWSGTHSIGLLNDEKKSNNAREIVCAILHDSEPSDSKCSVSAYVSRMGFSSESSGKPDKARRKSEPDS